MRISARNFFVVNLSSLSLAFLCGCPFGLPGDSCGIDTGCIPGTFCKFEDGRCDASAPATCTIIPRQCPLLYAPICGCDGHTYGNECEASGAGVSIDHAGACDSNGSVCGGLQGLECDTGEFCNFDDADCGAADQTGICEPIPEACTEIFAPVCGCDGETYSNDCFAHAAGVSVASQGECP